MPDPLRRTSQMLAYCTALKVPRAWLVYAQGGAGPVVRRIVNTDVSVVEYPLDLRAEPKDLLRQMDVLTDAAWLAAGRQPSPLDATGHTTGPSRPIDPTAPRPTPNAEVASTDLPSSKTTVVSPPAGVDGGRRIIRRGMAVLAGKCRVRPGARTGRRPGP